MKFNIDKASALIVVDVQRDFCPGGALPVPEGDKVVPALNRYIERFAKAGGACMCYTGLASSKPCILQDKRRPVATSLRSKHIRSGVS